MSGGRRIVLKEVDSTQLQARRLFEEGERGPLWILAHRQSAGRGRRARPWHSPLGNLHLSLLFTPPAPQERWPELSLLAALVAHKAIARLAALARRLDVREALALKWPNDLLLKGRKLGGVLLETLRDVQGRQALVIGWGINLAHAPPPAQTRWPAIALADAGLAPPPPELVQEVLQGAFWRWHQVWHEFGFANVREAWRKRAFGLGGMVRLQVQGQLLQGRFVDIGPAGELVLEMADGSRRLLHGGEIAQVEFGEAGGASQEGGNDG